MVLKWTENKSTGQIRLEVNSVFKKILFLNMIKVNI